MRASPYCWYRHNSLSSSQDVFYLLGWCFWCFFIPHQSSSCQLWNYVSLYEKLFDQTPNCSILRTYGCSCFPYLHPYNQNKLQFRSKRCVFLGYFHHLVPSAAKLFHWCFDIEVRLQNKKEINEPIWSISTTGFKWILSTGRPCTPLYRQYYLLLSLRAALFLILTSKMHLSIFSDEETYKHQPKEFDNPWFPRHVWCMSFA